MSFSHPVTLSGLDGTNGFTIPPILPSRADGTYLLQPTPVASAGDINGDGFDDVILGHSNTDPNGPGSGTTYVLFGRSGGWGATLDLASLDGSNGFRLTGSAPSDRSGFAVAGAGDVNGDGLDDMIIGAPGANAAYVVFGRTGGWAASMDLGSLDGTNGFRLNGSDPLADAGVSVASAGDMNGDGFADIVIGAPPYFTSAVGSAHVVFGGAHRWPSSFDLSTLNGSNGFHLNGIELFVRIGQNVATAGDVNGDGLADLLVTGGRTYIVAGKAGSWPANTDLLTRANGSVIALESFPLPLGAYGMAVSAGDTNGDGLADIIAGASQAARPGSLPGAPYPGGSVLLFGKMGGWDNVIPFWQLTSYAGRTFYGANDYDFAGQAVASAGDMNGDGFADLLIGAPRADSNGTDTGSVYVLLGQPGGWPGLSNLGDLSPDTGFRIDGPAANHNIGAALASAGDFNGDGFTDIIAYGWGSSDLAGRTYIYFSPATGNVTRMGTTLAERLRGGPGDDTLDGRGGHDTLDGQAGMDTASYATAPAAVIIDLLSQGLPQNTIGAGIDTLHNIEALLGSRFADRMRGDASANTLRGGTGDDALFAVAGNDSLDGGEGADTLFGSASGADTLNGGPGDDLYQINATGTSIAPPAGADRAFVTIHGWTPPTGLFAAHLAGNASTLVGGIANDQLIANAALPSLLSGGEGNDTLWGQDRPDTLQGGMGDDSMDGGADDDLLDGGAGIDIVSYDIAIAGVVIDLLSQGVAQNTVGSGLDTLRDVEALQGSRLGDRMRGDNAANTLRGEAGDDALFAWGGQDRLAGGDGADTLYGSGAGGDTLDGGLGDDLYQVNAVATTLVTGGGRDIAFVTINDWTAPSGLFAAQLAGNAVRLLGAAGADQLVANPALGSALSGGGADDTLWGLALADTLDGGEGDDVLRGGAGQDWLTGGQGDDLLVGGTGADVFHYSGGAQGHDRIFDFNRAEGDRIGIVYAGGPADLAALTLLESSGSTVVLFGTTRIDVDGVTGMVAGDFLFA